MSKTTQPPVLCVAVINAAQSDFVITHEELALIQLCRQVPFEDRRAAKGYLELSLRDFLKEQPSKQLALSLVKGGAA